MCTASARTTTVLLLALTMVPLPRTSRDSISKASSWRREARRLPTLPSVHRSWGVGGDALLIPVINFTVMVDTGAAPIFGTPIELDLDGRGIRSIEKNASDQYVILAEPAGAATGAALDNFALYTWTGQAASAPVLLAVDVNGGHADFGGSPEGIVEVPSVLTGAAQLQLVVDNGDSIYYSNGLTTKDLSYQPGLQKFVSQTVSLGSEVAIAADQASKAEGNAGTTAFTFTVTRSGDLSGAADVNYAVTGSGPNQANAADFDGGLLPSGSVDFIGGQAQAAITVNALGDTIPEPNEGFTVTLSNPSNTFIATGTASSTIADDDFDVTPPAVQGIARSSATPTNATLVEYSVNFSESVAGVGIADFDLTTTGVAGVFIVDVSGSGSAYTVLVQAGTGEGTIRLDLSDDDFDRQMVLAISSEGQVSATGISAARPTRSTARHRPSRSIRPRRRATRRTQALSRSTWCSARR